MDKQEFEKFKEDLCKRMEPYASRWMEKDKKDYTNEDFIEAVVYDLHQINTFSENAINLLNELFGRIYDK